MPPPKYGPPRFNIIHPSILLGYSEHILKRLELALVPPVTCEGHSHLKFGPERPQLFYSDRPAKCPRRWVHDRTGVTRPPFWYGIWRRRRRKGPSQQRQNQCYPCFLNRRFRVATFRTELTLPTFSQRTTEDQFLCSILQFDATLEFAEFGRSPAVWINSPLELKLFLSDDQILPPNSATLHNTLTPFPPPQIG